MEGSTGTILLHNANYIPIKYGACHFTHYVNPTAMFVLCIKLATES